MRFVNKEDRERYGCEYCAHSKDHKSNLKCKFNDCPYKEELRKYSSYLEYCEAETIPFWTEMK